MLPRLVVALLASLLILLQSSRADAGEVPTPLPIGTVRRVAAVAGAAPNARHPGGTLLMAWVDLHPGVVNVGEWAISDRRFVSRRALRKDCDSCDVQLARSGDAILALVGGHMISSDVGLEVISLGLDLSEKTSARLGKGSSPNLDVDRRYVLAGAWETRSPTVLPVVTRDRRIQPTDVFVLRVLDPVTLAVLGSRVFAGTHLLSPTFIGTAPSHAARLASGNAYVALADDDLHVARLTLPSLATEKERVFPKKDAYDWSTAALVIAGPSVLVVNNQELRLLATPTLTTVAETPKGGGVHYLYDAAAAALVTDSTFPPSRIGGVAVRPSPGTTWTGSTELVLAFGRRVVLVEDGQNTMSWGIAVLR